VRGTARADPLKRPARALIGATKAVAVLTVLLLALLSGYRAARNGYPIGGDHWAYQGIDEIVAYLEENASSGAVLYHRWLRWHYTYYLFDAVIVDAAIELRYWESGEHMQREALRTPDRQQYVVLPEWRTLELDAPGLRLELLYQARREDGSVSLSLYRVCPVLSEESEFL
jgi:hypothetical protein